MLVTKDRTMWPLTRYLTPYLTRFLIKRQFVTCHSFQRQFRKNSSVSGVSLCISLPTVPSSLYLPFLHPSSPSAVIALLLITFATGNQSVRFYNGQQT